MIWVAWECGIDFVRGVDFVGWEWGLVWDCNLIFPSVRRLDQIPICIQFRERAHQCQASLVR